MDARRSAPPTVRVALAGLPRLLRDTLRDVLEHEPDFTVVADVADPRQLARALDARAVDGLILGEGASALLPRELATLARASLSGGGVRVEAWGEERFMVAPALAEWLDALRTALRARPTRRDRA